MDFGASTLRAPANWERAMGIGFPWWTLDLRDARRRGDESHAIGGVLGRQQYANRLRLSPTPPVPCGPNRSHSTQFYLSLPQPTQEYLGVVMETSGIRLRLFGESLVQRAGSGVLGSACTRSEFQYPLGLLAAKPCMAHCLLAMFAWSTVPTNCCFGSPTRCLPSTSGPPCIG